ncbi:MBL fold metallo-hydrolase RNA specificity domain-containing protein [Desulfosarcina ovata]|uniref:MBL fold hydrolase n=2 Tax=Desulfosarcina ovata TaxID=83564 RepID=A0A5K8AAQ4_9BACT|nr:MBL fold metallo-hydrolase [Desulfosarcina ovata]BBO81904.1 MBL fold hydrolase [Desulfosarcina ovata subsp. sediminis]BBO89124.1 MBL fold hydrolase [Desulfosarcina ovata subsp. ovata]
MHITFYGAVREVTGSMHLLCTDHDRILLDCGMFQGRRKAAAEKNRVLPFDPGILTNMVLSHAHIDHSGRIPLITRNGFTGRVYCTRATADASAYLLPDSAHIQESDAGYLNYKTVRSALSQMRPGEDGKTSKRDLKEIKNLLKKNKHGLNADVIGSYIKRFHLQGVEPLYTITDAEEALTFFEGIPYRSPVTIGKKTTCTLYEAGHILGSAIAMIRSEVNGNPRTVCFSGDIGRYGKPILRDPASRFDSAGSDVDLLVLESTYGNRDHEPVVDLRPRLKQALNETFDRGGSVLIPSFAYGRTQELLYVIHELYDSGEVPRKPVYVDSPLATNITKVFGEHPEVYDREAHEQFLQQGKNPFSFRQVQFVESVEASMALMREESPHIVISASGMCEAGRILHHLRYKIHNPKNTVLIVGYMANHTLGRRILELGTAYEKAGRSGEPPIVKILNKEYPLKAHVVKIGGFSAHGDRNEMLRFLKQSGLKIKRIAVVHGEEDQSLAFAEQLRSEGYAAMVPRIGETLTI